MTKEKKESEKEKKESEKEKKESEKEKKESEKEKKFVGPQYEEIEKLFKDRGECSSPEPQER